MAQVEGIFEDCCKSLGMDAVALGTVTLLPKLEFIEKKGVSIWNYPYYAYRFPKLRNSLAHGAVLDAASWKRVSHFILLDLASAANELVSLKTLETELLELLKTGDPNRDKDLLKFASLLTDGAVDPPEFYELKDAFESFLAGLNNGKVWILMDSLSENCDDTAIETLRAIAIDLKKRKIRPVDAMKFLRTNHTSADGTADRMALWQALDDF